MAGGVTKSFDWRKVWFGRNKSDGISIMALTIHLPDGQQAVLAAKAQVHGQRLEELPGTLLMVK